MRVPISWLGDFVELPASTTGREVSDALINLGLEVETVDVVSDVTGPVVFGLVTAIEELTEFKKPIRFCQVDVGVANGGVRDIVCGAQNFAIGDVVVVALPGSVLPGDFAIAARQTYGHTSDGMICSARELELGDDYDGIMVIDPSGVAIGDLVGPTFGFGEEVLDIAVTPDRGYALSIRGVAREAAIAFGVPFHDKVLDLAELPAPADVAQPFGCSFDASGGCDVFTARTILEVDPTVTTPGWMTQRLLAAGMRPVSLIVDITNYVMLETGQPLHAFDLDRLNGDLQARRAAPGETLTTLDHVERTLDPEDLVIADASGPLGLAGTMGGVS
ncbi:MAG: phenylalanine--tRNA ligase subunit beta, partial [Actinobacteria bacterium]|nr:phenylalanine--tRNA ligase subunit beta [Actinomycetota bacterium]